MILITVGSVAPFDSLVMKADELAEGGALADVVAQIGNGSYVPRNARWFRFEVALTEYFKEAELVITHNGAGTIFELLALGKKTIAVPNPDTIQMENIDIVKKLNKDGHIMLCMDVEELGEALERARSWVPVPYSEPPCRIPGMIEEFLSGPPQQG
jgi:beta-1,4-N-acetylglucosaminyltransferase